MNYTNIRPINYQVGNATIDSAAVDSSYMFKVSGVVKSDHSSANGAMQLQVSNDPPTAAAPTNWANLGSSVAISGAGQTLVPQQDLAYRWLRAVYTDSSGGTATSNITFNLFGFTF